MRAKEFITEQRAKLNVDIADPMRHGYLIPGIRNNDAYRALRLGVAVARARADIGGVSQNFDPFEEESAFGQNALVFGFNDSVDEVIDRALQMTGTPGGKAILGTKESQEPSTVYKKSPVKSFKGYPR